jgi:hypothetical protein
MTVCNNYFLVICYDFVESDGAESDDGLSESGRVESDDELSESDDESDEEEEITHAVPFKYIGAAHEKITNIIWKRHTSLFMNKINQ